MLRIRTLTSIILIVVSILVAFFYVKPLYDGIMQVRGKKVRIDDALKKTKDIGNIINNLRLKMKSISDVDMSKIDVMLPKEIDEVRYFDMISSLADKYKIPISNLKMNSSKDNNKLGQPNSTTPQNNANGVTKIQDVSIQFSASSEYGVFKEFLKSLERSLVLLNVDSLSLNTSATGDSSSGGKDIYNYDIKLTTYLRK